MMDSRAHLHRTRTVQVHDYRSSLRVYRLIDRRNASLMVGKAVRREYFYDPFTNYGAW